MVAIVVIGVCYFYPSPQGPFRPHVRVWHIWLEDFLLPGPDPELLVLSPLFLCYSTWVSGSAWVWPFVPVWGQLCSFISVLCFQSPFLCWLRGRPLAIRAASHPHWLLGSAQGWRDNYGVMPGFTSSACSWLPVCARLPHLASLGLNLLFCLLRVEIPALSRNINLQIFCDNEDHFNQEYKWESALFTHMRCPSVTSEHSTASLAEILTSPLPKASFFSNMGPGLCLPVDSMRGLGNHSRRYHRVLPPPPLPP